MNACSSLIRSLWTAPPGPGCLSPRRLFLLLVGLLPSLALALAPAPENFTVFSGTAQAWLSWSASPGAASYNVQRAVVNGGPYTLLANVTATTYTDNTANNGVRYFYVVSAVSDGGAGPNSLQAAAIPLASGYYRFVNRVSGLALEDPNGAGSGGVVQQPYSGTNQVWRIFHLGSGIFAVLSGANNAALSGLTPSAQLTLSPFTSLSYQFWTFHNPTGTDYLVRNLNTGEVMDNFGSSTTAGTPIGQWVSNNGFNQHWIIEPMLPQLAAVAVTNAGLYSQYTFTGQVNPQGLETTLVYQLGADTSYATRVTNTIPAANGFVNFTHTVTIPDANTLVSAWHATVVASSLAGSVTHTDVSVPSPVLQLASVALTNGGALPQYIFTGTVNPGGLPTTLICQLGTNTSYGASVTNVIAATNAPVNFSVTIPYSLDRATTMHGLVTASNGFSTASSGDMTVSSISFEARFTAYVSGNVAWMDVNEDGYLDLAANGTSEPYWPRSWIWLNPGSAINGNSWSAWVQATSDGAGYDGCIIVGDLNLDNRPDAIFAGGRSPIPPSSSPDYAASGIWYSGMQDRTHFRDQSPIFGEMVGPHAVIADFDHSGKPSAVLCYDGGNYMLQGFLDPPVSPLLSLGTIVDGGAGIQGSLSGGFFGTNGFMDVFAFKPDLSKTGTFYRNDGELGFTVAGSFQLSPSIGDSLWSSANSAWADFNGDGFDDLLVLVSGRTGFTNLFLLNDGHGNFTNAGWTLPNWCLVNVGVGDLFHHGRPDIVMTGANHTGNGGGFGRNITVLRNDGNGVFTPVDYGLYPKSAPADQGVALADFDNDGRLDIAISGSAPENGWYADWNSTCVYRNLLDISSNAPPAAPGGLSSSVEPGRVNLSWGGATDDVTPANGLTYNLRIGTNSLGTQTVSPLANGTTGWRKSAARGNVGHCFGTYYKLPAGTYFWSVQAIDGAYAGGAWAAEGTFTVPTVPEAVADTVSRSAGRTLKVPFTTLLANDRAPAGPALTVTAVDATSAGGVPVQLVEGVVLYTPAGAFGANDSFSYTISDGTHTATATVSVTVQAAPETPTQNLVGTVVTGSGALEIKAAGIPGRSYRLQTAGSLNSPVVWTDLGAAQVAPANGQMTFTDPAPALPRFYRVVAAP